MAKIAFIILRVLVAIAALASLAATSLVILVIGFFNLAKGLLGAVFDVITVFASGFQKSPNTPAPNPDIRPQTNLRNGRSESPVEPPRPRSGSRIQNSVTGANCRSYLVLAYQ